MVWLELVVVDEVSVDDDCVVVLVVDGESVPDGEDGCVCVVVLDDVEDVVGAEGGRREELWHPPALVRSIRRGLFGFGFHTRQQRQR